MKTVGGYSVVPMSDVTGPIEIFLSEHDVEKLKDGETVEYELDTDLDGRTVIELEWHTVYESEGASELFNELSDAFNG